jgi:hypothetical protein
MIKNKLTTLLLVGIGLLLAVYVSGCVEKEMKVEITDPIEGQKVKNDITVRGTIEGELTADSYLWLLVGLDAESLWWPQGGGSITPINGEWSKKALIGGGPDLDIDKEFQIVAILVDEKANRDLNDWVERGKRTNNWPGITLPSGKILDKKNVIKVQG